MQELPADFWAPRACFEPPPPEVHQAVALLDQAADALIAGDRARAVELIAQADMPPIFEFVERIWGKVDKHIHRYRDVADAPIAAAFDGPRMPSASQQRELFKRDGWRCRFCGIRVVSPDILHKLRKALPLALRWDGANWQKHTGFMALRAVADHVVPRSRGGSNEADNLVTTCWPCNFGRNDWTLEEVGLRDPRLTPPLVDSWDGLTRLDGLEMPAAARLPLLDVKTTRIRAQQRLADSWRRIAGADRFRPLRPSYVIDNTANLVEGVALSDFDKDLKKGAGGELIGDPSKFCAAHSSSALAVNSFAPFKNRPGELTLAGQGGFDSVVFEQACDTGLDGTPPNLDVFCTAGNRIVAVESKCTEYLTAKPAKFRDSYGTLVPLLEPGWDKVFRMLNANPLQFAPLDAAQLVKHYLGLRKSHSGKDITLLYLFWEPEDAAEHSLFRDHRRQIGVFSRLVQASSVRFAAASYGELWAEWQQQDTPWLRTHVGRLQDRYGVRLN